MYFQMIDLSVLRVSGAPLPRRIIFASECTGQLFHFTLRFSTDSVEKCYKHMSFHNI